MSEAVRQRSENHILSALPEQGYQRLSPHLEPVQLRHGQLLYEAGWAMEYVYFPANSMVSLVSQPSNGSRAEIGVTGYEGIVGIYTVLGLETSPHEVVVQIPGGAIRMKAGVLLEEFRRGETLHDTLLSYINLMLLQAGQTTLCDRLHTIEERLARWLLMSHDRWRCDDLPLTQEFLAVMLGIRRADATEAALTLQAREYIDYTQGCVRILNRAGMEGFACECYGIVKDEFDRLLAG